MTERSGDPILINDQHPPLGIMTPNTAIKRERNMVEKKPLTLRKQVSEALGSNNEERLVVERRIAQIENEITRAHTSLTQSQKTTPTFPYKELLKLRKVLQNLPSDKQQEAEEYLADNGVDLTSPTFSAANANIIKALLDRINQPSDDQSVSIINRNTN